MRRERGRFTSAWAGGASAACGEAERGAMAQAGDMATSPLTRTMRAARLMMAFHWHLHTVGVKHLTTCAFERSHCSAMIEVSAYSPQDAIFTWFHSNQLSSGYTVGVPSKEEVYLPCIP